MAAGSDARVGCEPGQVGNEAAISSTSLVPSVTRSPFTATVFIWPTAPAPHRVIDVSVAHADSAAAASRRKITANVTNSPAATGRYSPSAYSSTHRSSSATHAAKNGNDLANDRS